MITKACLLALSLSFLCAALQAQTQTIQTDLVQVEDGDTLILQVQGTEERLQLAHIDAPEDSDNPKLQRDLSRTGLERERLLRLGQAATEHLKLLTQADSGPFSLTYDPGKRDRYGRLTGEVRDKSGRSLNAAMVEDGFARVLKPRSAAETAPDELLNAESTAIDASQGIWGSDREAALAWRGDTAL